MATITTLNDGITGASFRGQVNTNFDNLNTDKAELSGATFTGDILVPDEAYGAGWNGSLEVPTKNAVYDKIETMGGGGATTFLGLTDTPSSYTGQALKVPQVNAGETALEFVTLAGGGDALTTNPLSQFASTTSLQLAGVISDETGSGALVFATSPTLVTPVLGVATATSINGATITSGTLNGSVTGTNTGDNATNSNYTTLATTLATANSWSAVQTFTSPLITNGAINFNAPEGFMVNGKIVPSVASGNLTVALKTLAGTDASASNPIYVMIGGVVRTITSATSYTRASGVNWMNSGSAELATKEIDFFTYLYWSGSIVKIAFGRIVGSLAGDFSSDALNEKFMEAGYELLATDPVVNIGRFNAILSGAYSWSIPATSVIINSPIYETRWLDWTPVATGYTAGGAKYKIDRDSIYIIIDSTANITGNSTTPFKALNTVDNQMNTDIGTAVIVKNTSTITVASNPQNINGFYGI